MIHYPSFVDLRYGMRIAQLIWQSGVRMILDQCQRSKIQSVAACSGDFYGSRTVKTHSYFLFFLGGAFCKGISGSEGPATWDPPWTSELEFQSGYSHALLFVWLSCLCPFFMQYDLFGGWRMQLGPSDVLSPPQSTISFFSTTIFFF